MSHIVEIQTKIVGKEGETAVNEACSRLHLPRATRGTFQLYSTEATGLAIQLPDWKFPVVANTETGQLSYDNYQGRWGRQAVLFEFLKYFAVQRTKIEARRKGHSVVEQQLDNGSIKLTVQVGGVA